MPSFSSSSFAICSSPQGWVFASHLANQFPEIPLLILGGLVTSTVLNLLVLPSLALRYGRFESTTEE
jgi:hypothetical protein